MSQLSTLSAPQGAADIQDMDTFLAAIERRAFRMAQVATGEREAALDIVQDSMLKLVQRYGDRSAEQWRPLFYRILHNRIADWHRGQQRRWQVFDRWFGNGDAMEDGDALEQIGGHSGEEPDRQLLNQLTLQQLDSAIRTLSLRQQQAFMLRCWEGLSTAEAAGAMECTEGTVKTLYARALAALRIQLESYYD